MAVIVESGNGLRQEIHVRGKLVVADEPLDLGGTGEGPNPYELLLGALTKEQRARLHEISQRCPVHRTLTGTIRIDDELRIEPAGS